MKRLTVGIVDYGIGNHASVRHSLYEVGFRCRVGSEPGVLDGCDLLLLPGVGAFPPAMQALRARGLDRYIVDWANRGRPTLGICLGMQLLSQSSTEGGLTPGLGLIPGDVTPLGDRQWHIGWNTVERVARPEDDPLFRSSYGHAFYFNHSYIYRGAGEFDVGLTRGAEAFTSAVRRGKIVGVQFHPEKSQTAGRELLKNLVPGLCDA